MQVHYNLLKQHWKIKPSMINLNLTLAMSIKKHEIATQDLTITINEPQTASDEPQPAPLPHVKNNQQIVSTRRQRKVTFNGLPTCNPVDVNTMGLRNSPRLASLRRKTYTIKILTTLVF